MNAAAGEDSVPGGRASEAKGLVSRRWSRAVLNDAARMSDQPEGHAA